MFCINCHNCILQETFQTEKRRDTFKRILVESHVSPDINYIKHTLIKLILFYKWLQVNAGNQVVFGHIHGNCPHCKENISCVIE